MSVGYLPHAKIMESMRRFGGGRDSAPSLSVSVLTPNYAAELPGQVQKVAGLNVEPA